MVDFETVNGAHIDSEPPPSIETQATPPIPFIGAAEIFAELPPYPWLVPGLHIAPGRITLLSGFADVGKTVIAQSIALAVVAQRAVWGVYAPARTGIVLHLNGEIGSYLARERYQRLARAMDLDPAEIIESGRLRLANYPDLRLDDVDAEARLMAACEGGALVIIDSLRAFAGALDENAKEIGVALLMLARVSEKTGATVLVLHHNRKPQRDQMGGAKMSISGSGSIPGGAESIFVMNAEKGGPIVVEHERTPLGRKLETFGLRIEDVAHDNDPRWGLRVVHLEGEQLAKLDADAAASRAKVDTDRATACIRDALLRVGGVLKGSRDDLRIASGVGAVPFGRALSELCSKGSLERRGKYHHPEWVWLGERS
jgi:KaiC/GvpD/RAD55 family RecA-like ATPase